MPEPEVKIESINEKLSKGENLTPEETKFVMSLPPDEQNQNQPASEEDEEIDWEKAEDADEPKAKEEKKAQAPVEKEKAAQKAEEKAPAKEVEKSKLAVDMDKLEKDLAKPEGQEDLSQYNDREKAYFHQMRRDRKSRQKAEEERDAAKFELAKTKRQDPAAKPDLKPEDDPIEKLKKKSKTDFLTVGEVIDIFAKTGSATKTPEPDPAVTESAEKVKISYLRMCENEAKRNHEDFDLVMEAHDEIIKDHPEYLVQISQSIARGENPAEKTYELVKNDPEFAKILPAVEVRYNAKRSNKEKPAQKTAEDLAKEADAKKATEALAANAGKTKTTAHVGGSSPDASAELFDGYTVDQIFRMDPHQFRSLKKETRAKFVAKYG